MGQTTSFRLSFRTNADAVGVAQALVGIAHLPLHEARPIRYDDFTPVAMVTTDTSISDLLPDDVADPFWSFDGERVVFTADLVNPSYRDDDLPISEVGDPSRQSVLLDALSSICAAAEGTIVGGWESGHFDDWLPLVYKDGRILRAFVENFGNERPGAAGIQQHDGRLDPSLISVSERGSASISGAAFG